VTVRRLALSLMTNIAAACGPYGLFPSDDSRHVEGVVELQLDGAISATVRGAATAGYAATIAGGKYSLGLKSVALPGQLRSESKPGVSFLIAADSQPRQGTHAIASLTRDYRARPYASVRGPALETLWLSDSGGVVVTTSDPKTLAFVGTVDVWLTCLQVCPCAQSPCQVRARGSFRFP
jgi:hypothetical protein